MRIKLLSLLIIATGLANAQKISLPLNDAVQMAVSKSNSVNLAKTKVQTKGFELETVKNNRYPDVKVSGQYLRLTNADIDLRSSGNSGEANAEPESSPKVNQLALGQANVTMPLFSGFKLKNSIKASENLYRAEKSQSEYTTSQTILQVVEYYGELYKAQRAVEFLRESLKSANQRVREFTDRMENGLIARNDLLKTQLQVSKTQLSLDEAEKNVRMINYQLVTLLKLPAETEIEVDPDNVDKDLFSKTVKTEAEAVQSRKDLEALQFNKQAADAQIKVAKSGYFPSLALTGGYLALDMQNFVTVTNAMNFGVGVSYNLSSIFKNGKEVSAAKNRAKEVELRQAMLTDQIKTQIANARENYDLSIKQDGVYTDALKQADENYRIVKDKYENGLADTNDLLEADVEDLSARINLAYAKANLILKYYEWLEASGQLTESFNLTKN